MWTLQGCTSSNRLQMMDKESWKPIACCNLLVIIRCLRAQPTNHSLLPAHGKIYLHGKTCSSAHCIHRMAHHGAALNQTPVVPVEARHGAAVTYTIAVSMDAAHTPTRELILHPREKEPETRLTTHQINNHCRLDLDRSKHNYLDKRCELTRWNTIQHHNYHNCSLCDKIRPPDRYRSLHHHSHFRSAQATSLDQHSERDPSSNHCHTSADPNQREDS